LALKYLEELRIALPEVNKVLTPYPEAKKIFDTFYQMFKMNSPKMEEIIRKYAKDRGIDPTMPERPFNYSHFQGPNAAQGEPPDQYHDRVRKTPTVPAIRPR